MVRRKKKELFDSGYNRYKHILPMLLAVLLKRSDKFLLINRNTDGVKRNRKIKPIVLVLKLLSYLKT